MGTDGGTGPEPLQRRFRRALLVANPIAGRGRAARAAEELETRLRRLGLEVELFHTARRGDGAARVRARAAEADLVVSLGGDGTLGEVLGGLAQAQRADCPVAVYPVGTANVLALDLRLPRRVDELVALVQQGTTRRLDVGHVNGRTAFLVTGVGIDGRILAALDAARRGPITRATYVRYGLAALRGYRPPRLAVWVDGERVAGDFGWVLVSNIVHYGGVRFLSHDRRLDDGLWEVYLFPRGSRAALLGYALRGLRGGLPGGDCLRLPARRVRIESQDPVPYQVDGDYGGCTPVEIEVGARPFEILAP